MTVEVSRVESASDRNAFIKFPWRIYRDDPAWVPPLIIERKEFLNRDKHPFYRHGDAALFLARKDGEIVGRIMASDDPNYNALHQTNVGCFGMFESVNDPEVAAALFLFRGQVRVPRANGDLPVFRGTVHAARVRGREPVQSRVHAPYRGNGWK